MEMSSVHWANSQFVAQMNAPKNVRWMFVCEVTIGRKRGAGREVDGRVWGLIHIHSAFLQSCT